MSRSENIFSGNESFEQKKKENESTLNPTKNFQLDDNPVPFLRSHGIQSHPLLPEINQIGLNKKEKKRGEVTSFFKKNVNKKK